MRKTTWMKVGMLCMTLWFINSCKKDNQPLITDPSDPNALDSLELIPILNPSQTKEEQFNLPIGIIEIENAIQSKSLIRELIREAFTQLLLNYNFHPMTPIIDTREPSSDLNSNSNCNCPFQDQSLDPNPGTFPETVTLSYADPGDCGACTLTPSGLEVFGSMNIVFSESFSTSGHEISIFPNDNFTVDGFDIDADEITISHQGTFPAGAIGNQWDMSFYKFKALSNVAITNPAGATTTSNQIGSKSSLIIEDVNNNHGTIGNAFGLLDDIFSLDLKDLEVHCSNGTIVNEYSTVDLKYDMACSCIQEGIVVMDIPGTIQDPSYNYGYSGSGNPGECDDLIEVTTPCLNVQGDNQVETRSTSEIINCL